MLEMPDNAQLIRFHLNLSYEQYLAFYQGVIKTVMIKASDECNIFFLVSNVERYLTK